MNKYLMYGGGALLLIVGYVMYSKSASNGAATQAAADQSQITDLQNQLTGLQSISNSGGLGGGGLSYNPTTASTTPNTPVAATQSDSLSSLSSFLSGTNANTAAAISAGASTTQTGLADSLAANFINNNSNVKTAAGFSFTPTSGGGFNILSLDNIGQAINTLVPGGQSGAMLTNTQNQVAAANLLGAQSTSTLKAIGAQTLNPTVATLANNTSKK